MDEWVDEQLPPKCVVSPWPRPDDKKIIREPIHGYQVLAPYEYLILDTPIFQRLRHIHQTALAYLVYPGAHHTRLDHSLGVALVAEQVGRRLLCEEARIKELRLAALLHDVGHCLFSHLTESLMEQHFASLYLGARNAAVFQGKSLSLGEMLSYLIVTSPRFLELSRTIVDHYDKNVDVDNVARLIIGNPAPEFAYLGDIIHGPFDTDKLDYLVRDCYFSGIRADIDVPRVVVSADILDRSRFPSSSHPRRNLVMRRSGVSNLEQVTFNKMLLYPAIYHHHKVRAIECMIRGIFEAIWDSPDRIMCNRLRFSSIKDFLTTTEHDFFSLGLQEPYLEGYLKKLQTRQLLERCLVISMDYIVNPRARKDDVFKVSTEDHSEQIRRLRELMWDYLPKKWRTDFHELWIDLPKRPSIGRDADECFVDNGTGKLTYLRDYFPYPRWIESYQENKWKGHVFYSPLANHRLAANKAGIRLLRELYSVRQLDPSATNECKIPG